MKFSFHLNIFFLLFGGIVLFTSCSKTTLPPNFEASADMDIETMRSDITINYRIDKDSVNQSFNYLLDSLFSNDLGKAAMGFKVEIINLKNAKLEIQGKQILTVLPLRIVLTKETFISDIRVLGELEVTFISSLEVDSLWNLITETSLEDYNWTTKPEMSFWNINLSIKSLANIIIEKSKEDLENQIDSTINEQFQLNEQVERLMLLIKEPILIDSTLSKWLKLDADSIEISEVINKRKIFEGHATVFGRTQILNKKERNQVEKNDSNLPPLNWVSPEILNSRIHMNFDLPFKKLNRFANEKYANRPLSNAGKEILLSDIKISNDEGKLKSFAKVTGDFVGTVTIEGVPKFDHANQSLVTKDIEINFDTKNFLHKTGIWLMKGKIRNEISSMLNFSLKDKTDDIQKAINNQITDLNEQFGMKLTCDINKITLNEFVIKNNKIQVNLSLDLYLETTIHNLLNLNATLLN